MDWLSDLEAKVGAAAKSLKDLKRQNRSLKTRVKKLEGELAASRDGGKEAAKWQQERVKVRERVERLASALEELVED
jgi:chaperonin cofactor prefoldin